MHGITIRFLTEKDFTTVNDDVKRLLRQLVTDPEHIKDEWIRLTFRKTANLTAVFGAYTERGRLVGLATGVIKQHLTGRELYVDDVVVDEEAREQGVFKELMCKLADFGRMHRATKIQLTSSRLVAQDLYLKLGFTEKVALQKPL